MGLNRIGMLGTAALQPDGPPCNGLGSRRMSYKSDLEDVGVDLVHETEKAWLVTDGTIVDGELNRVWVPKSQAELDKTTRPLFTLTAPEWLLKDKGLI
jgi:hypothetical protein